MSIIPCEQNKQLRAQIERFAEILKTEAHTLGNHGLDEKEFYNSGLFRGAVERVRGQFSATMRGKREFVQHVLNHMEDAGRIAGWEHTDDSNRNDYRVQLNSGKTAVIDLKGCLDGNNTNIFERPSDADEFVIWSMCTNLGADPRRNAWSGIHTRLSAEMISRNQRVDGLIVWDMTCGTIGRHCPKIDGAPARQTDVGPFRTPPPCIYLFPATIPSADMPEVKAQAIDSVELLGAFHFCFDGHADELNYVDFTLSMNGGELVRKTMVRRAGVAQRESDMTAIRRV
ncbi:hypothetical protein WS84_25615 [Burkholderia anthina]|uniref:hypothetical protein n=1 Tax=Burkholderia cepacia complex TaxID=87882 RepID=UPI00075BE216|nr:MULTISPECIES: hypothetical protein [Burkholderia cepacia complex]BEV53293.1 hypothetical protein BconGalA64_57930 [Burkholderia contaminans]KVH06157.1 hypothetical protein WS84_25615 [Burkholderia anthina]KVH15210.1 hypothetical protein WS85_04525 [Burkholderia anthina]KVM83326.1 hypothetical protein WT06_30750 [Burkholderia anthina]KVX29609.1 hypothetical protein WT32_29190 [Burkholderia anthina]